MVSFGGASGSASAADSIPTLVLARSEVLQGILEASVAAVSCPSSESPVFLEPPLPMYSPASPRIGGGELEGKQFSVPGASAEGLEIPPGDEGVPAVVAGR